jgi:hypothetical protein
MDILSDRRNERGEAPARGRGLGLVTGRKNRNERPKGVKVDLFSLFPGGEKSEIWLNPISATGGPIYIEKRFKKWYR